MSETKSPASAALGADAPRHEPAYVLAFDTANEVIAIGVGVLHEEARAIELVAHAEIEARRQSNTQLIPRIDALLAERGIARGDIACVCVGRGPGSFTGVRIGVSLVKGLAFAGGTPCAAVSPLEALAKAHEAFPGVVCAVMDARRGQYYNALFQNGERLCSDRAIDTDALLAELGSGPVLVCGDGAALLCERARRENLRLAPESSREQNALSVALCGYRRWSLGYAVTPDALSPVYLRKPQAEREREERMNKGENKE